MKVFIERENKTKNVKTGETSVKKLLKTLRINSNSVLVVRNGELVTEGALLSDDDEIKIISVVSGG